MTNERKRAELEKIAAASAGRLTAAAVVEAARDSAHPLHGFFDWDDTTAAHQHRLAQGRELIRSVRVVVEVKGLAVVAPYYLSDPEPVKDGGYLAIPTVRTDAKLATRMILEELHRAASAIKRAREVAAALGFEGPIDDLLLRVQLTMEQAARRGDDAPPPPPADQ